MLDSSDCMEEDEVARSDGVDDTADAAVMVDKEAVVAEEEVGVEYDVVAMACDVESNLINTGSNDGAAGNGLGVLRSPAAPSVLLFALPALSLSSSSPSSSETSCVRNNARNDANLTNNSQLGTGVMVAKEECIPGGGRIVPYTVVAVWE